MSNVTIAESNLTLKATKDRDCQPMILCRINNLDSEQAEILTQKLVTKLGTKFDAEIKDEILNLGKKAALYTFTKADDLKAFLKEIPDGVIKGKDGKSINFNSFATKRRLVSVIDDFKSLSLGKAA